ncbi:MAG: tetratricopeptide repeat protein [Gammaproteobacteria bacterium]
MLNNISMRLPMAIVILVSSLAGSLAGADQHDSRLPALFEALQVASNPMAASSTEQEIWRIWHTSPNDEALAIMQDARRALDIGDAETAIAKLNVLIQKNPDFAEAWNQRAIVLYMTGDFEGSLRDVNRTVALEPNHFGAYSGMGQCLIRLDQPEAALEAFETALEIHPWLGNIKQQIDMLRAYVNSRNTPI